MFDLKHVTVNLPEKLVKRLVSALERLIEIGEHHFPTPKKGVKTKIDEGNYFTKTNEDLYDLEVARDNRIFRTGDGSDNPQADYDELLELKKGGRL